MGTGFAGAPATLAVCSDAERMAKVVDILSIVLLLAAISSFAVGVHLLGQERDVQALYLLVVGGLLLKSSIDMLRPKPGER